jgi:hypothetical protein
MFLLFSISIGVMFFFFLVVIKGRLLSYFSNGGLNGSEPKRNHYVSFGIFTNWGWNGVGYCFSLFIYFFFSFTVYFISDMPLIDIEKDIKRKGTKNGKA